MRPGPARAARAVIAATSVAVFAVLAMMAGCTDSETPAGPMSDHTLELTVTGFPPLAQSEATFELWISFALTRHSAAASAGRFMIDDARKIVGEDYQPAVFALDPEAPEVPTDESGAVLWQLAVDAFITVEPEVDPDPEPTLPALIAGSFLNRTAGLDVGGDDAIGANFSGIAGSFHLATPTTSDTSDENKGAWFATVGGGASSLTLPTLPTGWIYEGWHSHSFAGPRSLGRFRSAGGTDLSGWGPPGDANGYAFPGEDFPWGDVELPGGRVFVTIEPNDNVDGSAPFNVLQILAGDVSNAVGVMEPLGNVATFPTASVILPSTP